jgi:shikimate kinase
LARLTGREFVDLDDEVARLSGSTPDAMIRAGEEARFREFESQAMRAAMRRTGAVVACGGGAALHAELLRRVAALWPVVLLDARDDVLLARWALAPRAPLSGLPPALELARQRTERMHVYRALARRTLDTSDAPADESSEEIADASERDWTHPVRS